ncbi:SPX and EXS domain-containing protein 1 [Prunus yedoensis var. nudiflora]|uniref:SPX and EXS domain-containing protein 1 n=1 Tax=Prunus yedoensis var. nudiflora TaxID=2094558 RepID=A0A314XL00_PRUYE|nr:SPX and EXS domain-containing protein 1 [Prunus yedoensis var. nudiflora]
MKKTKTKGMYRIPVYLDPNFMQREEAGTPDPGYNIQEMKSPSSQLHSAAIFPSPAFLWRFKVLLFMIWGFSCCKIGWDSVMRMSADLRNLFLYEVFLYYNPLLVVTLMVWLWGVNLWVFSQSNVGYAKIFDLDQNHLTHKEIWKAISFPDFFLADILTSMAKVFSDLERSVCRMVRRQVATIAWLEADSVCGSHSIASSSACFSLSLPFISMSSSIQGYKRKDNPFQWWTNFYSPLWLLSSVVNSLYSFYWDIARDWDLSGFSRIFKFSRSSMLSNMFYGRKWVYFWVIGSNLVLRCTWTYKLSSHLRHNYLTVFTITALEILRRFQWIFFRVENEWNKISRSSLDQLLPMTGIQAEEEMLLETNNHIV